MTIARKLALLVLFALFGMGVMTAWFLVSERKLILEERQTGVRQVVEVAHGIAVHFHTLSTKGAMPDEEARQRAAAAMQALRYSGNEYIWINDMHPRMVMHPVRPELNGQDLSANKDPNGLPLFMEFVRIVKTRGAGFVPYMWPKAGSDIPVEKTSYVKGFEPWGWIVGSGIYIDDLRAETRQLWVMNLSITVAAVLFAGYLFLSFYRVMDGGLKETRRHLRAMTEGDLTTSPSPWGRDEAAQLMLELRHMQGSLREMVVQVRQSSDQIVHASNEVAAGSMDLSARTEQAAASLEQSASSMEQISATVNVTSGNTDEASRVARQNAESAKQGGQVMGEVVANMNQIRDSSNRIAEIIGTIDGIAFQTNILALNAAVEAARAGEQGRGFAVVAGEVRSLAQRSAEAAREIKSLIGNSVEQVELGTHVVQRAGHTIEDIVASAQRVNALLDEISTGSREQSLGVQQVGQALQELDRMTQQNAALVEQTAAASAAMRERATQLSNQVARFRLPA